MQQLVDNDTFLKRLTASFESTKDKGTIWLTHKRLTRDGGEDATMAEEEDGEQAYRCLIRVTDGKKTHFSTHVYPADLFKFHAAYASLLKTSFATLRKRDRKREKQRAEQVARRKQRMAADPVVVDGPKRGNGRRKRQRKVKAAMRQEQVKERAAKREEERARAAQRSSTS